MSVNGEYDITVHTPAGDRESHLSLQSDGHHLTGDQCIDHACQHIEYGAVHGDHFEWTSELADPHATLHFTAKCEDDVCSIISGDVDAGPLGHFPFSGKRK